MGGWVPAHGLPLRTDGIRVGEHVPADGLGGAVLGLSLHGGAVEGAGVVAAGYVQAVLVLAVALGLPHVG